MKVKHLISLSLAVAMVLGVAAQSSAMMRGRSHGPMMDGTGMGYYGQSLTAAQQSQIDKIEKKYQAELAVKETAIQKKTAALQAADSKDTTTLGELNKLTNQLYTLENDYWALRDKVNVEIGKTIGGNYYGNMGRGLDYCAWHNDHAGQPQMRHMYSQRGPMMGNGTGWCRW